jgi:hypothetical protein
MDLAIQLTNARTVNSADSDGYFAIRSRAMSHDEMDDLVPALAGFPNIKTVSSFTVC